MTKVISEAITVHGSPEAVWAVAGEPGVIGAWLPALAESSFNDGERVCTTGDGAEIRERIVEHSDAALSYTYEIVTSPMPRRSYRSTLSVDGHGDHSHVTWEAKFEAMFSGLSREGLASLGDRFEGAAVV